MARRKFIKIEDGYVTACILSNDEEMEGFIETDEPVAVGAPYDDATGTFGRPTPDTQRLLKALVLVTKFLLNETGVDKSKIPPAALEIWQDIKDDRL